jgi:hypothetical protein
MSNYDEDGNYIGDESVQNGENTPCDWVENE